MRSRYRNSAIVMAFLLCCARTAAAEPAPSTSDESADWLKIVPGEARFYVEVRDLAGIRRQFQRLGMWRTVREMAEPKMPGTTTRPWQSATEEHLQLTAEAAIHFFLGRRAALVATESAQWQNGVMLAELENGAELRIWLRRWQAKTLADEGPVRRYQLAGGILLAVSDRTLAFGPAGDPDGLWGRTVLLMAGRRGPTLAGRAEFAALRSRLSAGYPSLLYVVWPDGDPTAVGGCSRLLVGVSVNESGISCELRGQRVARDDAEAPLTISILRNLPASTLAVRAGSFDFDRITESTKGRNAAQEDTLLRLFLRGLTEGDRDPGESAPDLGPEYVVVVGKDQTVPSRGFDMPAATVICQSTGGEDYLRRLDHTMRIVAMLLAHVVTPSDQSSERMAVEVTDCEGVQLHHIKVGPALADRTGFGFLENVDVCWALLEGRLILSTSLAHVQEIVRATTGGQITHLGDEANLKDLLPAANEANPVVEWWFARGSAVAEMVSGWLDYWRRQQPRAMKPEWWQKWATERLAHRTQLGIGLATDATDPHRAVVRELEKKSPALRVLRVGDIVVGAAGAPLSTTQPAREVAERYASRRDETQFAMQVLRNGQTINVTIPVPQAPSVDLKGFDPVRALTQLTTLSSHAKSATVWRYAVAPDRFDARIQVYWEPITSPTTKPSAFPGKRR